MIEFHGRIYYNTNCTWPIYEIEVEKLGYINQKVNTIITLPKDFWHESHDQIAHSLSDALYSSIRNFYLKYGDFPMLVKGKKARTKKGFSKNVKTEMKAGKPQKEALAISYSVARRSKKKKD